MLKILLMILLIAILGTLDKLKPSDIKGSRRLKWWSWGAPSVTIMMSRDV